MLDAKVFSCNMWLFQKVGVKNGRLWAGHVCAHPSVQGLPRQGPQLYPWQVGPMGLSQGWRFGESKEIVSFGFCRNVSIWIYFGAPDNCGPNPNLHLVFTSFWHTPCLVDVPFKIINLVGCQEAADIGGRPDEAVGPGGQHGCAHRVQRRERLQVRASQGSCAEVRADQGLSDLGQPDHGQVGGGPGFGGCSWER